MKIDTPDRLLEQMRRILSDPERPLLAAAIGVIRDGEVLFADAVGTTRPDGGAPAAADTKYRIASISKLITALGVWQLIEAGRLDPDDDVSDYLGFRLRNPAWPDTPITLRMLLSHTSSIRDGGIPGSYNIPFGHHISEFFTPGAPHYNPRGWAPQEEAPGEFFAYCNMNYCLLGTIVEAVSGERFDRYMISHIFAPLGLSCSYNVAGMPPQVRAKVGPLWRKLNAAGEQDPDNGVWTIQADDPAETPAGDHDGYVIGTNGSLFGPMGSLRISIEELCRLMLLFCRGGSLDGVRILKPETAERMFTPVWTYDPVRKNGDNYGGLMNCYGMGPHIFTNRDSGDRMVRGLELPFAGHTAEAYGLIGGMGFDREKGNGIVYFTAGLGGDMAKAAGQYSMFYRWEEELLTAGAEFAGFGY